MPSGPFRFFDLPREIRDQVYSYLVVIRGAVTPIFESNAILRLQNKRASAAKARERLNWKRKQSEKPPVGRKNLVKEPLIQINVLQTSRQLYGEAHEYMYKHNWFAISLDTLPITTPRIPFGWDIAMITKMQLELQLKDAKRMDSYIDWTTLFAKFKTLRFLRIIPTYHPRYYDWAHCELSSWDTAHFVFRAFFRELLASLPRTIIYFEWDHLSKRKKTCAWKEGAAFREKYCETCTPK